MQTLGELLKELRESKELLLRQVAAAIEVDTAMISKFEKGERKPTREQLIKLAKTFKIDEKKLLLNFLSDKVAFDLKDEDFAKEALKIAGKKIDLFKKNKKN